jgi:hypothetical protein
MAQSDGVTPMDEINFWFTLGIEKRPMKEAVGYRVNIVVACRITGTWLIIIIIIIIFVVKGPAADATDRDEDDQFFCFSV